MPSSNYNYKVLCIGDLVADIFASPLERLPRPGELVLADTIAVYPGGNALNTAVALARLGEPVAMAGSIGDDALGDLLLGAIQERGVDGSGIHRERGGSTSSTFILRAEGEDRRFIHSLGVAGQFSGEHIDADLIPEQGIVLVGGYLKLAGWDDGILAGLLQKAREKQTKVVFNVCLAQDSGVDPNRCLWLLEHVDIFILNEDEARIITNETDLKRQAEVMRRAGAGTVVITRGQNGLYADDGQSVVEMGIYRVPLVDPSGCGDCFNAGLVAGLLHGWEIERVLHCGSAVGALGATALGCTNGVPPFNEVETFMKENTPQ
ncbi:hypothetical protein GF373_07940 [bacterium]|nr:hypothetical protein [bacterium]